MVAYSVEQRVGEFGIRTTLGATPWSVQWMILRECAVLVAVGTSAGLLVSLAASRAIRGMLFGIGPNDGVTFILAPSILAAVALLACWIPAFRASRISPSRALHEE